MKPNTKMCIYTIFNTILNTATEYTDEAIVLVNLVNIGFNLVETHILFSGFISIFINNSIVSFILIHISHYTRCIFSVVRDVDV